MPKGKKRVVWTDVIRGIRYTREEQWCGKKNCTKCPHGPYYWAYPPSKEGTAENGFRRIPQKPIYIGKVFVAIDTPEFREIKAKRKLARKLMEISRAEREEKRRNRDA